MNVNNAAAFVALADPGRAQVAVEDAKQPVRDVAWNTGRSPGKRFGTGDPGRGGLGSQPGEFVGEPAADVVGQVAADGQRAAGPALLVGGVEGQRLRPGFQAKLSDGQRA